MKDNEGVSKATFTKIGCCMRFNRNHHATADSWVVVVLLFASYELSFWKRLLSNEVLHIKGFYTKMILGLNGTFNKLTLLLFSTFNSVKQECRPGCYCCVGLVRYFLFSCSFVSGFTLGACIGADKINWNIGICNLFLVQNICKFVMAL